MDETVKCQQKVHMEGLKLFSCLIPMATKIPQCHKTSNFPHALVIALVLVKVVIVIVVIDPET